MGSEELKGDERLRAAAELLRQSHIGPQFHGFVEGHDIAAGTTDVVVTDGFTGNVALKTGEGALKLVGELLRPGVHLERGGAAGYLLARPGLERLREWLDPRRYNGAMMLGLNGVVVKSHGGTDAEGFAHAVDVAMDMVTHRFNDRIRDGLWRNSTWRAPRCACRHAGGSPADGGGIRAVSARCWRGSAPTCPSAWSATTSSRARWTPRTPGSPSAPASAAPPGRGARDRRLHGRAAARAALEQAGVSAAEVDLVVLATSTPDQAFPATAVRVQAALGIQAASASTSRRRAAASSTRSRSPTPSMPLGHGRAALVIGSEVYSRILDWTDRGTCVLFGDGAGAVLLRGSPGPAAGEGRGILSTHLHAEGRHGDILYVDGAVGRPERPGTW